MITRLGRRWRHISLLAAGAVAVAVATACGGGGDATGLSLGEYREEAQTICRRSEETAASIQVVTVEDLERLLEAQRGDVAAFDALEPPEELAAGHDEFVDVLEGLVGLTGEARMRITQGENPQEVFSDLDPRGRELTAQASALAEDLDLPDCAAGSDAADQPPAADLQEYLGDVGAASMGLVAFGEGLQAVSSPEEIRDAAPMLLQRLDDFDAAIERMAGYRLTQPELEEQRSCLVESADPVSDTLRRFTEAAQSGDVDAVTDLLPEVSEALGDFQSAASGGC